MDPADSAHTLAHYQGLLNAARAERRAEPPTPLDAARFRRDLDWFGLKEAERVNAFEKRNPPDSPEPTLKERVARLEQEMAQLRKDLDKKIDQKIRGTRQRVMNLESDRGRGA